MSELGSHNGNGIRFRMYLSAPKGGVAQMLRDPAGDWVTYDEYLAEKEHAERLEAENSILINKTDRLIADVERLTNFKAKADQSEAEVERLKAEVELLNAEKDQAKHDDDTCPHLVRASLLETENARLKAEVERLTKELSNISGWGRGLESDLSHARVEISFLKAEVGRLRLIAYDEKQHNANLRAELEQLRQADKQVAMVLADIQGSGQITCAISRGVIKSTLAKWQKANPTK